MSAKRANMQQISLILLTLLAIGLLIMIMAPVLFAMEKGFDRVACQVSLIAQTPIESAASTIFFATCPSYDVVITDKKITISDGKNTEDFEVIHNGRARKKYSELEEDFVYQVLSTEMRHCWKLFFEGNRDVFRKDWFEARWKDKVVCFACSTIIFETTEPQQFTNYEGYLKNNLVAHDSKKRTYYDYFTQTPQSNKATLEDIRSKLGTPLNATISTRNRYLITYVKGGEDVFGFTVFPNIEGNNALVLAPYQTMNEKCTDWVYPTTR